MYYDGTKLLSLSDLNGKKPELYMCTTNRSGGKTTFFNRMVVNRFLKQDKKFCLMYRYNYELDDISDKFFKDIKILFFNEYNITSKRRCHGIFHELFISKIDDEKNEKSCGYAVSINSADQIKKYSHLFSDVESIIFDEFQSETNHYCSDEIKKFLSVHKSMARGRGKQIRYLPVYMLANQVTIINPYYVELGISERLNSETKFLRGDGFVLENGFIESASIAQKESGINRAFANNQYVTFSSENVYLNDNSSFVENISGKSKYLATIRCNGKDYGVREFRENGIIYCDDRADKSFPFKVCVTTDDHNINYVMLKNSDLFISSMRYFFERGCFRFKSVMCKEAILKCLSY